MGACATKPKTLEGKAPQEAAISTPKVAPATVSTEVAADEVIEKVVEEAREVPALMVTVEPPTNAEPEEEAEASLEAIVEPNPKEEEVEVEVEEKIVEEEKPSAPAEETSTTKVEEEPTATEVAKDVEEEKEKPTQS